MFSSTSTPRRCVCSTHRAASYFDIDLPSAAAAAKLLENDFFLFSCLCHLIIARPSGSVVAPDDTRPHSNDAQRMSSSCTVMMMNADQQSADDIVSCHS